jgi:hypothetical protein
VKIQSPSGRGGLGELPCSTLWNSCFASHDTVAQILIEH